MKKFKKHCINELLKLGGNAATDSIFISRSLSVENPLGKFQSYVKFQALTMGRYTKGTRV